MSYLEYSLPTKLQMEISLPENVGNPKLPRLNPKYNDFGFGLTLGFQGVVLTLAYGWFRLGLGLSWVRIVLVCWIGLVQVGLGLGQFRLTLFGLIQVWVDFEFGSWIAYFGFGLCWVWVSQARLGLGLVRLGLGQLRFGLGCIQVDFGIAFGLTLDLI